MSHRWLMAFVAAARQERFLAVLVAAGVFLLYALTLSRTPTGDSLLAALAVQRGDLTSLLIPHRLLIQPLAWLFFQGWSALGWSGGALLPL